VPSPEWAVSVPSYALRCAGYAKFFDWLHSLASVQCKTLQGERTLANARGDIDSPLVTVQFKEIEDTVRFERERESSVLIALLHPSKRKRMLIVATFPIMVMLPGTNIV
jgi:hypothetical protein